MFTIIHKEMKNVAAFIVAIVLFEALLEKLGISNENKLRPDAQSIIFVLMWFALVAYRSVEKLAALERPSKLVDRSS